MRIFSNFRSLWQIFSPCIQEMAWAICLLAVAFLSSPWHPLTQSQSRTYSSFYTEIVLSSNLFPSGVFHSLYVSCSILNMLGHVLLMFSHKLATSLAHLPPSHCFPLLPFYVFLDAVLLVHKCGKYWLNVLCSCLLLQFCDVLDLADYSPASCLCDRYSLYANFRWHGLSGKTSAWPQIQLRCLLAIASFLFLSMP